MLNLLLTLCYFLLALALLIAVHEFGHFLVARLCGVQVLRFSLGFGKPLIKWRGKQGTDYMISIFPLGGYIKMLDETEAPVPPELLSKAFNRKPLWQRTAVVVAGPLFNLIFALVAVWLMFVIGITSLAPIIGIVDPDSIAAHAQLKPMDEIVAVNNQQVNSWRGLQLRLMPLVGSSAPIRLEVHNLTSGQHRNVSLNINQWQLDPQYPDMLGSLGITPAIPAIPPIVGNVLPKYPAQLAGLQAGDKIIAVNSKPVSDWTTVVTIIQNQPDHDMTMKVQRGTTTLALNLHTRVVKRSGKQYGFIGAQSQAVTWPKSWIRLQRYSMIDAIGPAFSEVAILTKTTFIVLGRFVMGKLSLRTISGPIGIAQGAGESAEIGIAYYLSFLALISVSLGVLNILPIPLLDGGHLLYYVLEFIFRKPVAEEYKLIGMRIGLVILLALMLLAIFNDISRLAAS